VPERTVVIATRKSRLALAQAALAERALIQSDPKVVSALLPLSTTGDKKLDWSLEDQGGKGLFTKEIEEALIRGQADLAVHSAKDLPTEMPEDLVLAAFLPRETVHDILVLRSGIESPQKIGTGSPRRRAQLKKLFPDAIFEEIRGNVETRLRKVKEGVVDATILAAAGLRRLGITPVDGVVFCELSLEEMVPACGQAAIALQCRREDEEVFRVLNDEKTMRAVLAERLFLSSLGGGCHSAFAGYFDGAKEFIAFHEGYGMRKVALPEDQLPSLADFFQNEFREWIPA